MHCLGQNGRAEGQHNTSPCASCYQHMESCPELCNLVGTTPTTTKIDTQGCVHQVTMYSFAEVKVLITSCQLLTVVAPSLNQCKR